MIGRFILALWLLFVAAAAHAQTFPALGGRVVDGANLLDPVREQAITEKLANLESTTGRQLVVATVPSLQDYPIEDYGYRLGRAWGIGTAADNDGAILLVAPNERKVRIEVGYGLEPILTDALSSIIIRETILPRFRDGDMPGGIMAGVDAIVEQLRLPEAEAQARQAQIVSRAEQQGDGGGWVPMIFWGAVLLFFVLPALFGRKRRGRRYRGPVVIWGPGFGGGWGSSGGGWGGGGSGGFGGFSGGGGSFGGGGASGGW